MSRSVKSLLVTLLTIGAISAVAVPEAQADAGEIHIDVGPRANLYGQPLAGHPHVLKIGIEKVECTGASLEATVENVQGDQTQLTTKEVTATAEYFDCKIGMAAVQVKMNGCKYTFLGTAALTAQVQVVGCTTGKAIEVIFPGCTITVGEQKELGHVVFTNENPGGGQPEPMETDTRDLIANATVTGIVYARDGFFCPQGAAELSGATTIRAYKDLGAGSQDKIGDHQFTTLAYGAQVGVFAT
jgi:hypothetical protein